MKPTPLPSTTKDCSVCRNTLSTIEFYATTHSKDGLLSRCKNCHKAAVLARQKERPDLVNLKNALWKKVNRRKVALYEKRRRDARSPEQRKAYYRRATLRQAYGMTREHYDEKLASQNERCVLCAVHISEVNRMFAVDHDHVTGKIRDLLCHHCNTALARLEAIEGWAHKAIAYLDKHKT